MENTSINIWSLVFDILWGYNKSTLASLVGHFKRYFTCTNSSQFSIQFYYLSCFVVTKEKKEYIHILIEKNVLKFRHYEKATKFEKNLPPVLTKQLFLLSSVKSSGRFFQIFVTFSEKLDFKRNHKFVSGLHGCLNNWLPSLIHLFETGKKNVDI